MHRPTHRLTASGPTGISTPLALRPRQHTPYDLLERALQSQTERQASRRHWAAVVSLWSTLLSILGRKPKSRTRDLRPRNAKVHAWVDEPFSTDPGNVARVKTPHHINVARCKAKKIEKRRARNRMARKTRRLQRQRAKS